jgi:hypothetical protein
MGRLSWLQGALRLGKLCPKTCQPSIPAIATPDRVGRMLPHGRQLAGSEHFLKFRAALRG